MLQLVSVSFENSEEKKKWNWLCASCMCHFPRCLNQMEEDGLSIDDLFSQCVFQQNERDLLLKAIRFVKSDYQPSLNLQTNQCNSPLVRDFYAQVWYSDYFRSYVGSCSADAIVTKMYCQFICCSPLTLLLKPKWMNVSECFMLMYDMKCLHWHFGT